MIIKAPTPESKSPDPHSTSRLENYKVQVFSGHCFDCMIIKFIPYAAGDI